MLFIYLDFYYTALKIVFLLNPGAYGCKALLKNTPTLLKARLINRGNITNHWKCSNCGKV